MPSGWYVLDCAFGLNYSGQLSINEQPKGLTRLHSGSCTCNSLNGKQSGKHMVSGLMPSGVSFCRESVKTVVIHIKSVRLQETVCVTIIIVQFVE